MQNKNECESGNIKQQLMQIFVSNFTKMLF